MNLLDLAQAFDQTPAANLPARVALAEQMRPLLGTRYEAFDAAFEALCASTPEHPAPAVAIVGWMYEEHREAARAFVRPWHILHCQGEPLPTPKDYDFACVIKAALGLKDGNPSTPGPPNPPHVR